MLHMLFGLLFIGVAVGGVLGIEALDEKTNIDVDKNRYVVPLILTYIALGIIGLLGLMIFVSGFANTAVELYFWIEGLST